MKVQYRHESNADEGTVLGRVAHPYLMVPPAGIGSCTHLIYNCACAQDERSLDPGRDLGPRLQQAIAKWLPAFDLMRERNSSSRR